MRMARRKLGEQFNPVVSKCLYAGPVSVSSLVEAIVSLRKFRRIICTNYDDFLEEGYTRLGTKSRPIVQGEDLPLAGDEVLIFHPHGFLPRGACDYSKARIVLSEDDYHELYASSYSWPNLVQLNLFISFNVLFVGCSLSDPNLRRLLDISKKGRTPNHFAIMKNSDSESHARTLSANRRTQPRWWKELMSFAKRVETENLNERGITPIWYEEHSDVSRILSDIT
jgi:hypothetical protein